MRGMTCFCVVYSVGLEGDEVDLWGLGCLGGEYGGK